MRTFRKSTAIWAAVVALVGCTVAIPDAAHFPEARDAQADNAVADAADVAKDVKIDTVDAKDVAGTDAIDVKPDAPDAPTRQGDLAFAFDSGFAFSAWELNIGYKGNIV